MKTQDLLLLLGGAYVISRSMRPEIKIDLPQMPKLDSLIQFPEIPKLEDLFQKKKKKGIPIEHMRPSKRNKILDDARAFLGQIGLDLGTFDPKKFTTPIEQVPIPRREEILTQTESFLSRFGLNMGIYAPKQQPRVITPGAATPRVITPPGHYMNLGPGYDPYLSAKYGRPVTMAESNALATMQGHMLSRGITPSTGATKKLPRTRVKKTITRTSKSRQATRRKKAAQRKSRTQRAASRKAARARRYSK